MENITLLNEAQIRQHLHDPNVEMTILEGTSSTNDYFKGHAPTPHLQVCFAEHQTTGRGRFHRSWIAPFGSNILMSCRLSFSKNLQELGTLSLCVGLSVLKALQSLDIKDLGCKWPNDLMYQHQKLAGVLIETQGSVNQKIDVIIGIGLNVNLSADILATIDRPTTSLQMLLGAAQDRNHIAAAIINGLCADLERFQNQGFSAFQAEWDQHDILHGQEITLNLDHGQVIGKAVGVDPAGQLLLQLPSGETRAYSAGEVSLSKRH